MIAVIGCGNANRSDDGAGPQVLRVLKERHAGFDSDDVRLLDAGTDGMAVMFAARGCETLIVVDACRTGAEPGMTYEVPGERLEQSHTAAFTLHDFRWDHALFAGRKIFGQEFPKDVTAILIEAQSLDFGIGLSPPVHAAVDAVAERIAAMVASRIKGEVQ